VLSGHLADAVVGRDVLIGVALGIWFSLLIRGVALAFGAESSIAFPGDVELLSGVRSTAGVVLQEAPYAVRNVLLYFFVLFALRVLLRRQWAAVLAFVGFFTVLEALGNDRAWLGAALGVLYFGTAAFVIVRRGGLLAFMVGAFVSSLLFDVIVTLDPSAWYTGNTLLLLGIIVGLTLWSFYTAVGGRLWSAQGSRS